ncbi:MAG TPA: 2-oxoglutarate dehydrogenase E1 component, partial [Gammaproteobacteria bacterium]|nr:2-oxoglutarate dehydrogenase E1 component [Gammaproteobacteria bacterium]
MEGDNAAYLEGLYEQYLQNPESVEQNWREYFSQLPIVNHHHQETRHSRVRDYFRNFSARPVATLDTCSTLYHSAFEHDRKQVQVLQLINAYRFLGHFKAKTNPLGKSSTIDPVELTLAHHQLEADDLNRVFNTGSLVAPAEMTLGSIIEQLQQTYCGSIGVEYMHMTGTKEKRWIQRHLESVRAAPEYSRSQRRYILDRLTAAEVLERFLHSKYVGQKRFSLEGAESLIPLLDELIQSAGNKGVKEVVLGMAHRGRLNVLVNILGKSPALLFKEFEGTNDHHNRTGDVKYHMGFASDMNTPGGPIHLAM